MRHQWGAALDNQKSHCGPLMDALLQTLIYTYQQTTRGSIIKATMRVIKKKKKEHIPFIDDFTAFITNILISALIKATFTWI